MIQTHLHMQLKKGQIIDLVIERIAFEGAGIGKYEGLVTFVNGTMPRDKVKAAFTRIKKDFAEARLVEIVSPSPDRIKPRCKYFDVCGGCHFQFMSYEKQLAVKKQHVIDAFERIGKIKNPPVEDVIGCKEPYYYRNKMEFSFGYDGEMKFALGMHLPGRRYDILDLEECYLQSELSNKILGVFRKFCVEKKWLPFKFSTDEGLLRSLYVREGKRTNECMVNLVISENIPENFEKDVEELVAKLTALKDGDKKITSIYYSQVISRRGVPRQIKESLVYGKRTLSEKLVMENGDELVFDILPQAFFQVNTFQAEVLYNEVLKLALAKSHNMVFDLFCGTGTIGLFMAKHVEKVFGIELSPEAIKVAYKNAQKNNIFNVDFFIGDVGELLYKINERPSLIIIDPPRAGLTKKIIQRLNDFGPPEIIYVSCNPATLARDCQMLGEYGYKVKKITPVDMFPHSYHIENVCLLSRD